MDNTLVQLHDGTETTISALIEGDANESGVELTQEDDRTSVDDKFILWEIARML